jgi:hypothetical protein
MEMISVLQTRIKVFRDFSEMDIQMKPYFDELLKLNPPQGSEYNFTNIFIWRHLYRFRVCLVGDTICIKGTDRNGIESFIIIAKDTDAYINTVKYLVAAYKREGKTFNMFRVEERFIELLKQAFPSMTYENDRDNADYVYSASDLIGLKGRKYDGKRNHIKKFKGKYVYEYADITDRLIGDCIKLTETWYVTKNDPSLEPDVIATKEALTHFTELGLKGSAIVIDGSVRAFSIAEPLNPDTAVIHIEKYDPAYEGIPQIINQQLCEHVCGAYKYINREQDLGNQGIRRSKLSYNPVFILNKYRVRI